MTDINKFIFDNIIREVTKVIKPAVDAVLPGAMDKILPPPPDPLEDIKKLVYYPSDVEKQVIRSAIFGRLLSDGSPVTQNILSRDTMISGEDSFNRSNQWWIDIPLPLKELNLKPMEARVALIGSRLEISNPKNSKKVVVRISNDHVQHNWIGRTSELVYNTLECTDKTIVMIKWVDPKTPLGEVTNER